VDQAGQARSRQLPGHVDEGADGAGFVDLQPAQAQGVIRLSAAMKPCWAIPSGWFFPRHPLRQGILPRQVDTGVLAGQQQLDAHVIDAGGV